MGRLLWFNYPCLLLHNYILSDWVRVYCAIAQWFEGLPLCCWVENLNPYQPNWHGSSVHNHQWYNSNIIMNQKPLDPWKTRNGVMLCAYVACRFCSLYAWTNTYNIQALLSTSWYRTAPPMHPQITHKNASQMMHCFIRNIMHVRLLG